MWWRTTLFQHLRGRKICKFKAILFSIASTQPELINTVRTKSGFFPILIRKVINMSSKTYQQPCFSCFFFLLKHFLCICRCMMCMWMIEETYVMVCTQLSGVFSVSSHRFQGLTSGHQTHIANLCTCFQDKKPHAGKLGSNREIYKETLSHKKLLLDKDQGMKAVQRQQWLQAGGPTPPSTVPVSLSPQQSAPTAWNYTNTIVTTLTNKGAKS